MIAFVAIIGCSSTPKSTVAEKPPLLPALDSSPSVEKVKFIFQSSVSHFYNGELEKFRLTVRELETTPRVLRAEQGDKTSRSTWNKRVDEWELAVGRLAKQAETNDSAAIAVALADVSQALGKLKQGN